MPKRLFTALALIAIIALVALAIMGAGSAGASTPPTQPTPTSSPTTNAPTTTSPRSTEAPTTIAASASSTTGIAIALPQNGDTVVNTQVQITGTAPPDVLVSVSILDSDMSRTEIAHQPNGRVDGSVTSDADGSWAFVAQVDMTPGAFTALASYTANNVKVDSPAVQFVVVNGSGESSLPSTWLKWKIAIVVVLVLGGIGAIVRHRLRRGSHPVHQHRHLIGKLAATLEDLPHNAAPHRHYRHATTTENVPEAQPLFMSTVEGRNYQRRQAQKMRDMDDEMRGIERALAATAESLEQSNRTIIALRHQISNDDDMGADDEPEVDVEVQVVARPAPVKAKPKAAPKVTAKVTPKPTPRAKPRAKPRPKPALEVGSQPEVTIATEPEDDSTSAWRIGMAP